ncbi:MAG TPA: ankyrin repeat domain-containing protein [Planktothrix sp.]|jgi:ankyrin repeat protein
MQIHLAATRNDKNAVLRQLGLGVSVDARDEYGSTPLICAASSRKADLSMLALLVEHGSDINAVSTEYPSTPFTAAFGSIEKVRYLMSLGADPYKLSGGKPQEMPWTTSFDVVKLLAELGFDPTLRHGISPSMLESAVRDCNWELARVLRDCGAAIEREWTPFEQAIIFGTAADVKVHLQNGADIVAPLAWMRTPLLLSICTGDVSKTELLLSAGASLDERGHCEESSLDCAVLSRSAPMLNWILSQGLDVNMLGCVQRTPLILAAEEGIAVATEILIQHGADVNAKPFVDMPALNAATTSEVAKLLVAAGADINYIDSTGNFPLREAVGTDNTELVRGLIELGANVDLCSYGPTPLHLASMHDKIEIMQLLIDAGADPNIVDTDECCALLCVKSLEAAQLLVSAGANLRYRHPNGDHLLDVDLKSRQFDDEICDFLKGARVC